MKLEARGSLAGEKSGYNDRNNYSEKLFSLQDKRYREFNLPIVNDPAAKIIGVRVPQLRKMAKEINSGTADFLPTPLADEKNAFLSVLPHEYHEENLIHIYLLNMISDFDKWLSEIERFLPYISNWAVCDNYNSLAVKKNHGLALPQILRWIKSGKPYTCRYGIGLLMSHFLDGDFSADHLETVASIRSDHYYVNMMRAWYFATALAKQYESAIKIIEEKRLDEWTHKKTIQKARESFRVSDAHKKYLLEMQ